MALIGLTGGIASGKSTVSALFAELGAHVICADTLAREVVAPGSPALIEITERLGAGYLRADGTLDRKALGKRVFTDAVARKILEEILHPRIRAAFERAVRKSAGTVPHRVIVYDAPLLIEAGAHHEMDYVVVVAVDRETQISRLMARDRMARAEAEQRIAAQMPLDERLRYADEVLDGALPVGTLRERVRMIMARWLPSA